MKEIKELTDEEISIEIGELLPYLMLSRQTGMEDSFEWKGLDYWDADRRFHKLCQEDILRQLNKNTQI